MRSFVKKGCLQNSTLCHRWNIITFNLMHKLKAGCKEMCNGRGEHNRAVVNWLAGLVPIQPSQHLYEFIIKTDGGYNCEQTDWIKIHHLTSWYLHNLLNKKQLPRLPQIHGFVTWLEMSLHRKNINWIGYWWGKRGGYFHASSTLIHI